ncbi:MAG: glutamyl-tRNA amidotransferase [Anaerolineae bacterium]
MLFAVNGTLMRNLELNQNMLDAGGAFVGEAHTAPVYRMWSIDNRYPGMVRVNKDGVALALELWEIAAAGLAQILEKEPPGLTVGRVLLDDGREVLGVLAESYVTQNKVEISHFGGWRAYLGRQ